MLLPLTDEGSLVGLIKLSSRFLQDKVLHKFQRILPEMSLSRFAALQSLSFAIVVAVLIYLLSPILTPFAVVAILLVAFRCEKAWYLCNAMYHKP
jgi:hypothetical protein